MPPTIYVVRHAQGEHNVNRRHHLRDPEITTLGRQQCAQLKSTFLHHDEINIIMASPLLRTIQTASLCFGPALKNPDVPFLLIPTAQEIANQPCDIGYAPAELKSRVREMLGREELEFEPETKVDFGLVQEGWNSKKGIYAATYQAVEARAAALRAWLYQRPEKTIVLVSHGAFLHYFSEDWTFFDGAKGTAYENCEFRKFEFSAESSAKEAHVVEQGGEGGGVKQGRPNGVHAHVLEGIEEVEKGNL